ncbi:uncharacterized protein EAE98_001469 [Botrytis deweyae]|uniref:CCHC-type domain-containing protein n=1 Tax=Botrytis deweyae TaxID=2478750 RepID=A0ABQ7IXZ0_9HELO|nr:uncharacterized protein EAE98_001469 [Botrytis deweyae]KAF7937155.1 hypothetical protein EAE98_001469 [Botrytis deweyae]
MSRRENSRGRSRSRSRPPQDRPIVQDVDDDIYIIRVPPSMTHRIAEIMGRRPPQNLQASQGPHQPNRSNQDQNSGNGSGNGNSNSNVQNGSKSENGGRPDSNVQNRSESEQRGRTKSRGPSTNDKKTQIDPKSGNEPRTETAANDDGIDEIVQRTKRIRWYNAICCWCGQKGHRAVRCPGPPDQVTGQIHACAFCNSRAHISEQCKDNFDAGNAKDWEALEKIMLVIRRNLPMLACSVSPNAWPNSKAGEVYENCRPWTGDYALKYEAENPDYAKKYVVNKLKEDDIDLGADPWWANPFSKLRYRLFVPKPIRVVDSEYIISKKRELVDREMTDDEPSRKIQKIDAAESKFGSTILSQASYAPGSNTPVQTKVKQEPRDPSYNAFDIIGSFMPNCTNCGDEEHKPKDCLQSCGACGATNHLKDNCIEANKSFAFAVKKE